MELDQQIQDLITNAPQDGKTPVLVRAIAPALKKMAGQLKRTQYYVLQTDDQAWVVTSLAHRSEPLQQKKVVYAYPTVADARADSHNSDNSMVIAIPLPVTHILFQMLAMKTVDGMVFFETSDTSSSAIEVTKKQLEDAIREAYLGAKARSQHPSDIA